ncbi:MAG TPA: dihydrofolate reductase family protein [Nocardioidaceae bacterium]|nr:dihydrofolate reductase family protein [Nocardioidaceae bacterium]
MAATGAHGPGTRLMRVLLGDPSASLASLYAYPSSPARPFVRANMVSSLDGSAVGADGRSGSVNTSADREVFQLLRSLADVIVVGAGTARTERYGRAGTTDLVVVSRSGSVPPRLAEPAPAASGSAASGAAASGAAASGSAASGSAASGSGSVWLVTCAAAGADALAEARSALGEDRVVELGDSTVDLAALVSWLGSQGWLRVLCEGGPHLLHDLVALDLLDELCLTVAPSLVGGDGPRILTGGPVSRPVRPESLLLADDGTLLGRWSCRP